MAQRDNHAPDGARVRSELRIAGAADRVFVGDANRYALRMFVDHLGSPRPLDVSRIDADSVSTLATFPVDDEIGTVDVPEDIADRLLPPLVVLVSHTANKPELFVKVVSVEPQFWNACVEVSVAELHDDLIRGGVIRRARDLGADVIECFLRLGYVLRCLDEAFAINT